MYCFVNRESIINAFYRFGSAKLLFLNVVLEYLFMVILHY